MKYRAFLLGAIAAVVAGPATAQRAEPTPLPAELPALSLMHQVDATTDDTARLALLDRILVILTQPTPLRGTALCIRAATLQQLQRLADAREGFDQCRQLRPDDPRVLLAIAFDEIRQKRPAPAAQLIIRASKLDAHALDNIDSSSIDMVLRLLRYDRQDALADTMVEALVAAGYGRSSPATFSTLAQRAILSRLKHGDIAAASALLPSVTSPDSGLRMLIDRQFAPIWPQVEQWAGSDLAAQRRALLAGARATFEQDGTAESRLAYANALVQTGHRPEAIAVIDDWLSGTATPAAEDQWTRTMAIVQQGHWIAGGGRRDEAIKRMRAALKAGERSDANTGTANIVPNLATEQLLARDFAGAKATLDQFTPPTESLESPASAGFFVALRACALQGLGQHAAAAALLRQVETQYATTFNAVDYAVACVASPDEQARHWIESARDGQRRSGALIKLATARYRQKKALTMLTLDEEMLRQIESRDDVRRTFDELGRNLPESYEPAFDNFNAVARPRPVDSGPVA